MKRMTNDFYRDAASGSALLITVVLTSLLAVVGVLFAIVARMDRIGSQATGQRRQLDMGVDSLLTLLSRDLTEDVPGVAQQEYYDYPDDNDPWLAALEPSASNVGYVWRQITNLAGTVPAHKDLPIVLVQDREPIRAIDPNTGRLLQDQVADADGDGVGDAKWFRLDAVTVNQQKAIYAAIRVIDHGAMVNINTAHAFSLGGDPLPTEVDGSHQMQIDVVSMMMDLVDANDRDEQPYAANAQRLFQWRADGGTWVWDSPHDVFRNRRDYLRDVVQQFGPMPAIYTPYDVSDELALRNRFVLKHQDVRTRVCGDLRVLFQSGARVPFGQAANDRDRWLKATDGQARSAGYDSQHLCTTLSVDRLIDPDGKPMVMLDLRSDPNDIYRAILASVNANDPMQADVAAQLAANIGAYLEVDENIFELQANGRTFFGFSPQPFIRGISFTIDPTDPTDPGRNRFEIELYNPFRVNLTSDDFWIEIWKKDQLTQLSGTPLYAHNLSLFDPQSADPQTVVLRSHDPNRPEPSRTMPLAVYGGAGPQLLENYDIRLVRKRQLAPGSLANPDLYIDGFTTSSTWFELGSVGDGATRRYYRDDPNDPNDDWRVVYPQATDPSARLVNLNLPTFSEQDFKTVGELSRILRIGHTGDRNNTLGMQIERLLATWPGATDPNALELQRQIYFDLADPLYSNIFQRLAVPMTGRRPTVTPAFETRIKGRINVNTAPALVIEKLPWLDFERQRLEKTGKALDIAGDVVRYRDRIGGVRSIGELMRIPALKCLADDDSDNSFDDSTPRGPDLSRDLSRDDLEERDLLFHRISNLITVRSDVFSAYILVRIGAEGPQRRVLAILDRGQVTANGSGGHTGRVKLVALQRVPDPR